MVIQTPARLLFIALAVSLSACSATEMVHSWTNPQFARPVASILVVGQMKDPLLRPELEKSLVATLQARGVKAAPSYLVLPESTDMVPAELNDRARDLGCEGLLVTQLVEAQVEIFPGYGSAGLAAPGVFDKPWYGYYGYGYFGYVPPFYEEATHPVNIFVFDTSLYTPDAGLVWSAKTKTRTPESVRDKIDELTKELVGQMEAQGLLGNAPKHPAALPGENSTRAVSLGRAE